MSRPLSFLSGNSVASKNLTEGQPWAFVGDEQVGKKLRTQPKAQRRTAMMNPTIDWNIYTPLVGLSKFERVGRDNPVHVVRGLVIDYDARTTTEAILTAIETLPDGFYPQFIERTLSDNVRLVWRFEREVLVPGSDFCQEFLTLLIKKLRADTLLAGYDAASVKPTEVWTNGGKWEELESVPPLSYKYLVGIICDVGRNKRFFSSGDIPLDVVAEEVKKKFPGRWSGDFRLDAVGVRFYDELADCPTGCQIKPDGVLCFTGRMPFVSWRDIFGGEWVDKQRAGHLGEAGSGHFFDGRSYWEEVGGKWVNTSRQDVILNIKRKGISDRTPKGATISEAESVLHYVQHGGRVDGAAPLINHPPGLLEIEGRRILNTSAVRALKPAEKISGDPCVDFPFLWSFLTGHFARPELKPLDHFLAWLQRYYRAILEYKTLMGQAIFLCGPKGNGKTLLCLKIVAPLVGNKYTCPIDYFVGDTAFNDDLFTATLLTVNDEDAPSSEAAKQRFAARVKAFVVNPSHTYHPKFCARVTVNWVGRIFMTLNDDPTSTGMLPEVNSNTEDKMCFFASKPFEGEWGDNLSIEKHLSDELPLFARWLLDYYTPPACVVAPGRLGVKSYYDPLVLEMARQQASSYNLLEVIRAWMRMDNYWLHEGSLDWVGSPTDLMAIIGTSDGLAPLAKEWTARKVAGSLMALARSDGSGVHLTEGDRQFKLIKNEII